MADRSRSDDRKADEKSHAEVEEPVKSKVQSAKGKSQMDSKQMDRMKSSLQTKKEKMNQAKEEERNFVEFRKQQILYQCRPESKVTARTKADDSFPRRKRGVSMGFGELKSKLLGIRPDPKYATWFGKKTVKKEKRKLSLLPGGSHHHSSSKPKLEPTKDAKSLMANPVDDAEDDMMPVVRKGHRDGRVLDTNGSPFWTNCEPEEDMEDDDCIVNFEVLEKVFNSEMKLEDPYDQRKKFEVYASVNALSKLDQTFEKKVLFSNTIRTVVALHEDRNKNQDLGDPDPQEIRWVETFKKTSYNNASAKSNWKTDEHPLKDIVKK